MIIYRIFFWVLWSLSVFFIHLCLWFQSVRCSPPWPVLLSALFRHAHWYFFKFFCTQENSFPFPFVLKWCVFISLLHLPFTSLGSGHGRAAHSPLSAVHTIQNIKFSFPTLRLSLAWKFCSVSVFLSSAHTLQRRLSVCSRRISPSVRLFPPHCELGGILSCRSCWEESRSTLGNFSRHIADVEVFLENLTDIQSSNLNSHDAVLDLFNFCIVLYVRFRYFLEVTFAILGFFLLAKKIRELLGTNG